MMLNPWAAVLGLVAISLPLAIHWLTRPRPRRLPFSAIRFVQEVVRQRRARHRVRDALVLSLRGLAVALLGLAIARPLLGDRQLVNPDDSGQAVRVVLVDVSQSMAVETNGVRLFERARSVAAGYLADQPELQANLVLAGARPRPVFDRVSANFSALREELAQAQPRPERLHLQPALSIAGELLANAGGDDERRRELVIVSDFQRSSWSAADFSVLPRGTVIELESIAPATPPANLAVLKVELLGRAEEGRDVRLAVEVGNFSATPRQLKVELVVGASSHQLDGLCPANSKVVLTADVPVRGTGWQAGEARLIGVDDALAADNVRPFVVELRPAPKFALLSRQNATQVPSSSYFLERALAPAPRPGSKTAVVARVDPGLLNQSAPVEGPLAGADVIVLDHPGKLGGEAIKHLANFLRRGRGLLYVAAEPDDAVNLRLLADAAGTDLQLPVEFVPPPAAQRRRDLFLTEIRRDQVPFSVFGDSLTGLVGPLRFGGGLTSRRLEDRLADDVLASYSDRSACLVMTACGAGTLAVLNADLGVSSLAASPAFVPLLSELTGRLLGAGRARDSAPSGEPLSILLPPTAGSRAGLVIVAPSGADTEAGELVDESGGIAWRSPAAGRPGVYQVQRDGRPIQALAIALAAEESDLAYLDSHVFQERLAGAYRVHYRTAVSERESGDDTWVWLALLCLVCVFGELLVLRLFRT